MTKCTLFLWSTTRRLCLIAMCGNIWTRCTAKLLLLTTTTMYVVCSVLSLLSSLAWQLSKENMTWRIFCDFDGLRLSVSDFLCIYVYMYVCMSAVVCVCKYVCVLLCYICMYIYCAVFYEEKSGQCRWHCDWWCCESCDWSTCLLKKGER